MQHTLAQLFSEYEKCDQNPEKINKILLCFHFYCCSSFISFSCSSQFSSFIMRLAVLNNQFFNYFVISSAAVFIWLINEFRRPREERWKKKRSAKLAKNACSKRIQSKWKDLNVNKNCVNIFFVRSFDLCYWSRYTLVFVSQWFIDLVCIQLSTAVRCWNYCVSTYCHSDGGNVVYIHRCEFQYSTCFFFRACRLHYSHRKCVI